MLSFCKASKNFNVELTHDKYADEVFRNQPELIEFQKVNVLIINDFRHTLIEENGY